MTDVVFNKDLALKEFEVLPESITKWLSDNGISGCCGVSKGAIYTLHFTAAPAEDQVSGIDAYWANLTDDGSFTAEQSKQAALAIEEKKIGFGIKVRAFLGYQCELNNFTPEQYAAMLGDSSLAFCSQLLISGALESVKGIIDSYTPTAYFTDSMKTAMSAELAKYIALV